MSQAQALDTRIVIVELDLNGKRKRFEGMACTFSVTKTAGAMMNEGEIKIANLAKEDRDYILTCASPLKRHRERKRVALYVGYKSTGTVRLFVGDITAATVTQPPDIWLCLKAKTGYFMRSALVARSAPEQADLSGLAGGVAADMGLKLDWQATDKKIGNYSFTGGAGLQVGKLGEAGGVNAFVDDDRLVVKDAGAALKGKMRVLNQDSGMIGIPELTEQGVKVKMLFDPVTTVGGMLQIESKINPAANGNYIIFKTAYTGESHGLPFYIEAEARPQGRASYGR